MCYKKELRSRKNVTHRNDLGSPVVTITCATLDFNIRKKKIHNQELTSANVHNQVLKFFISGNIPFQQVDNPQFKELLSFIKIHGQDYVTQTRKTLRTNLTSWCELAKQDLTTILCQNDSKVSLALDCWTSRKKDPYLGM